MITGRSDEMNTIVALDEKPNPNHKMTTGAVAILGVAKNAHR
jgi:hypothetical protein